MKGQRSLEMSCISNFGKVFPLKFGIIKQCIDYLFNHNDYINYNTLDTIKFKFQWKLLDKPNIYKCNRASYEKMYVSFFLHCCLL